VDGAPRDANLAALTALKEAGDAPLFGAYKLAEARSVSLRELAQTTRIDVKALDPTASEISLEDLQDTLIKVVVGCTLGAIAWASVTDFLNVDAGVRFVGTYLFAGIPIGILAVGSTAPGLLFAPIEAFRAATANEEEKRLRAQRVCKHEAAHLLTAYVLGLPIQEVSAEAAGPRVVVYDEEAAVTSGQLVGADKIDRLATVAVAGLMAEADAYGQALGAAEDLKLLNGLLIRTTPQIPPGKMQDKTRNAALVAWTILKRYQAAFDAIVAALAGGQGLAATLKAAEAAEAAKSRASSTLATAEAEAVAKETPQEKAARERAEMAAEGKRF